jgi:dihydropteroate synthase
MDMNHLGQKKFVYTFGKRKYDLFSRTHLMGILNVTPDSFSDGGRYLALDSAVERAMEMVEEGADIIDVGGESTRPKSKDYGDGASEVPVDEELRRVIPVIERLSKLTDTPVSIDTYKAVVAERALEAGAVIVNDISGFAFDEMMPSVVASFGASAVLMHIKGSPKTMQLNPTYNDLFGEIIDYLQKGIEKGERHGIRQMIVDPGLGFGKRQEDNIQLILGLSRFGSLGYPVLVGPSRKSFIGTILGLPLEERLEGTLATVVASVLNGANIVRVHDVKEAKRAVMVADALRQVEA